MKTRIIILAIALALSPVAQAAQAACYADYKAKQDKPLRLHYGVVKLPENASKKTQAESYFAQQLSAHSWNL